MVETNLDYVLNMFYKYHSGVDLFYMLDRVDREYLFKKLLPKIVEWDNDDKYENGTTWLGDKIEQAKGEI
jgi:hypothetical protein